MTIKLPRQISSGALDKIGMIDNTCLLKKITAIDAKPALDVLREMFAKI